MRTRVQKWGNSLALRIPKSFAAEAGLQSDTAVELSLEDGKLVIIPVAVPRFSLTEMLGNVTLDNIHTEVQTGDAVGNEIW